MASTAPMQVRFPDGTIRHGHYGATADICGDCLHADRQPYKRDHDWYPEPTEVSDGDVRKVRIAVDYGNGFSWDGTATLDRLITGHSPYGQDDPIQGGWIFEPGQNYEAGLPDWWQT